MELREVLAWVISGGGAAVLGYWLMEHIPALAELQSEWKRYVAYVLTAGIAIGAYMVEYIFGYVQPPAPEWRAWVEVLFQVASVAVGLGQIIHARMKLSER